MTGATGPAGGSGPAEAITAYSTPAQPVTDGGNLIFDRNAVRSGTAVSHAPGSAVLTAAKPGVYYVSFNGTLTPAAGADFPRYAVVYLLQDGNIAPGSGAEYVFRESGESENLSFSLAVSVAVSSEFSVEVLGGNFIASSLALTIVRLGAVSA